jgi:protein involved in polysaccharide export with SLBB domain
MLVYGRRLLGCALLFGCGCRIISPEEFNALQRINTAIAHARKTYVVQPGDTVRITVWRGGEVAKEYSQEVTVQPDGKVSLINLERPIDTKNLNVGELQTRIQEAYYSLFAGNQGAAGYRISVQFLTSTKAQWLPDQVYIAGEVKRPGAVPYRKGLTALQALTQAGSWLYTGDESRIVLMRQSEEGKTVTRELDLGSAVNHEGDDVELFPGDVVFVPITGIYRVNLWVEFYIRNMLPVNPTVLRSIAIGAGP